MSSRLAIAAFLVFALPVRVLPQKLINGFTREFAISGLPAAPALKSFDVNGDGVSELFVIKGSRLLVFDGKTFSRLFEDSTAPGTANLSPADVNRDGSADLVASSKDTAVVVWYGPDFMSRRVFVVDSGFSAFAVRNRDDGQVEFSFGYWHEHCRPVSLCDECNYDGHLLRYLDTTFTFLDSIHLEATPTQMQIIDVLGDGSQTLLLIGRDNVFHFCMPSYYFESTVVEFLRNGQPSAITALGISSGTPALPCQLPLLKTYTVGGIDADSGKEFASFFQQFFSPFCPSPNWYFRVSNILTGQLQWERRDSLNILV